MTEPITYIPPGPVAREFMCSDAFVRGIRGPIGSGKSTACVFEILRRAQAQKPGPDGKRRSRWAVIRNTYPELKTTTIKTWHQWVSPEIGKWVDQGPPRHHIVDNNIDMEVLFLALDSPEDIKKLLSLELTGAWINEAREVPKAVLDGLTGRVGRYPAKRDGGASWSGIIMDTNAPDSDHWWAKLADFPDEETSKNTLLAETQLREMGALADNQPLYAWYSQPGGTDPRAENMDNLPLGYYVKATAGKTQDWINVYVHNIYGFVQEGKPVVPEYRDSLHCKDFTLNPALPLYVGIDFGLTPAATFGQRSMLGHWRIHRELVTFDMGAVRFGELLLQFINENYPGYNFAAITGDPAGDTRAQSDETTPFQMLNRVINPKGDQEGMNASPAHTNDFNIRREALAMPMTKIIDGEPGLVIHPSCSYLRKGLSGGYHYKRVQVSGAERWKDKPDKNIYSHVCEAAQYMFLGAGEGKKLIKRSVDTRNRAKRAISEYNILG